MPKLTDDELTAMSAEALITPKEELGTAWVAPGQGSTWRELIAAFGNNQARAIAAIYRQIGHGAQVKLVLKRRTNLLLTGNALTNEDRERWESGNIK